MANATGGMRPSAPQYGPKKKPSATPKPKPSKWEDTKKAMAQYEAMQARILAEFGFKAPVTKVAGTPKATKKTTPSPKPKTTKGPTQRQMLDVSNMTPAQKAAYLRQQRNAY